MGKEYKCAECKYEHLSECEHPCSVCKWKERGLAFLVKIDYFEPKEEQATIEHNGCDGCYYDWLGESDAPCCECKCCFVPGTGAYLHAKDYFKPKKEKGCNECVYEHAEPYEEPCIVCQRNFIKGTNDFEGRIDYFKPKEDEKDMVNHPQHYVGHGIEPIEFIESHNLNFNLGSAVKYIARAPYKGKELEDLKKAKWFIEREIKKHEPNY